MLTTEDLEAMDDGYEVVMEEDLEEDQMETVDVFWLEKMPLTERILLDMQVATLQEIANIEEAINSFEFEMGAGIESAEE